MKRRTAYELLVKAKKLIKDKDNWCTRAFARDSFGTSVLPADKSACKWCASGAVLCVESAYPESSETRALQLLETFAFCHSAAYTNDEYGHAAVMTMYDKAIAYAKENNL